MSRILEPKQSDPWWVIVLKIIAYAIGLIIGGIGTMASGQLFGIINAPASGTHHSIEMRALINKTDGQKVCTWPAVSTNSVQTNLK